MGDYVVAAKLDVEEAEGISLSSKPLNMEEIHTNQGPPRPTGKETLGEATLKSKSVALADPELFDSIHIFKKYPDLLQLLQRNQSPEEVIKEFMEKVLDDHPQKDIINLDLLFGFLGPKDVLGPWFEVAIEDIVQSKEFQFVGEEVKFGSNFNQIMQTNLAALVKSHQSPVPPTTELEAHAKLLDLDQKAIIDRILNHGNNLSKYFGSPSELERALDMMKSKIFYQSFMQQLKRVCNFTNPYRGLLAKLIKTNFNKFNPLLKKMDAKDSTPLTSTTNQSKKKSSPNRLACKEEQLAITWIHVSKQPEFAVNQSGAVFYKKMKEYFNTHSKIHYRDHAQIKTR
ncbi:hypothetical protein PCANC_27150 [Puccinia coronata f. sp. avenae]|nr:hypothetical protein PCANC_27150 [Puccinia coronata f. sp. avenae]PLW23663.1 hypothetical protein PCASD_13563 [Puccinia coronata f. sp. avenae]